MCASQYLLQFDLDVQHKFDCLYIVLDVLSRLLTFVDKKTIENIDEFNEVDGFASKIEILIINKLVEQNKKKRNNLTIKEIFDNAIFFYAYLLKINIDFKRHLLDAYNKFLK